MEDMRCLGYMAYLSVVPTRYREIQCLTFGVSSAAFVVGKLSGITVNNLWASTPGFFGGFISISFSIFGYDRKTVEV